MTEGLEILQHRHPSVDLMVRGLRIAGWIALAHGHNDLAVRFVTAAEAERQRIDYVDPPAEATRATQALTEAQRLLGDAEQDPPTQAAQHAPFTTVLNQALDYLHDIAENPA